MKLFLYICFFVFLNINAFAGYEKWNCVSKNKCISKFNDPNTGTLNIVFKGKTKNNLPYKGSINFPGLGVYAEGTWNFLSNNEPILIEGYKSVDGRKFYYKKKLLYKTIFSNGDRFEGSHYKSLRPKDGTYLKNNGYKYKGTFYDREKNIIKTGTAYLASGEKIVHKNNKQSSKKSKSQRKNSSIIGGAFTQIFGLLTFFIVYGIVHVPCSLLFKSTQNSLAKIGVIIGGVVVYVFLLTTVHNFIGFEIDSGPPGGSKPRFLGESR